MAHPLHRLQLLQALQDVTTTEFAAVEEKFARLLEIGCRATGMAQAWVVRMPAHGAATVLAGHGSTASPGPHHDRLVRKALGQARALRSADGSAIALRMDAAHAPASALCWATPIARGVLDAFTQRLLGQVAAAVVAEWRQRHQAQTLQALSEWQRVILQGANLSIIATATDGTILSFNKAAENMLGYGADEVVGKVTPAIVHDVGEVVERAAQLSLELGQTISPGFDVFVAKTRMGIAEEREWTYIRKDGSRFPVLLSVTALRDGQGTIQGYLGIAIDLTLRKDLEQAAARARANELSRELVHALAHGVIGIGSTPPHRVHFLNPEAERLLGVREARAVGQPLDAVMELLDLPQHGHPGHFLSDLLQGRLAHAMEATVRATASGQQFPAACTLSTMGGSTGRHLSVISLQDIGERKLREQKLRLSDKVFEYSSEAIMITDPDGTIVRINPAFTLLTGFRPDEVIGQTPSLLKSGRHDAAFYAAMWRALRVQGHWSGELWDRRKDGTVYPKWLTISAVREDQRISHFVALFSDISERKANEERIHYLAHHDTLTGLPNRLMLKEQAALALARAQRSNSRAALIFIDLDRFKNINDSLGHHVGDRFLIEVSRRLLECLRATDIAARVGGDEFFVLAENVVDQKDAAEVAIKIHASLGEPVVIDGQQLHAPPSIGISLYPDDGRDVESLMQRADTAMYQVKGSGRNAWMFYTPQMNEVVQERLELEQDLRRGLAQQEFRVYFQPQWGAGNRLTGWEALLRWPHATRGLVPPDRFIPIAEDTGLILALGDWVLRSACAEVRRWEVAGLGRHNVSVNLSARQFRQATLGQRIAEVLADTGLAPQRLELEITESVLMEDAENANAILRELKHLGVRVAIDDFGTGYSSLAYLKAFAVDRLKIDRSFVRDITQDPNDAAIVSAIISLARSMGLQVIAEGVEYEAQRTHLLELGCTQIQGHLLGRPLPAEDVVNLLRQTNGLGCS